MSPTIKDLVTVNKVRFRYYRKGELWYDVIESIEVPVDTERSTETTTHERAVFTFPVPISDCGDGTFNAEDKAILYMRYIRKQLEEMKKEGQTQ